MHAMTIRGTSIREVRDAVMRTNTFGYARRKEFFDKATAVDLLEECAQAAIVERTRRATDGATW